MGVDHRGSNVPMTQQRLHRPQVHPILDQVRRKARPERMARDRLSDARLSNGPLGVHGWASVAADPKPLFRVGEVAPTWPQWSAASSHRGRRCRTCPRPCGGFNGRSYRLPCGGCVTSSGCRGRGDWLRYLRGNNHAQAPRSAQPGGPHMQLPSTTTGTPSRIEAFRTKS